ncbi:unnamed protein product (macronuclear) [Paramecium tetraurelia]|uniref:Uncharacterized protein n=1 Tax=Paramecium tetraurelia TaxID=5888 RepID=A0D971_PARTE|nr:uncharacterized protein GSPATT00014534001 [Paramecium tetraurelia]CAK79588.1 unnamed protein product [Paramecium tetraurelia]|eukprot:XP_001446985.1 hypothetical protein (macronuclear) [Paramecium tetraurelia strain d4-2]
MGEDDKAITNLVKQRRIIHLKLGSLYQKHHQKIEAQNDYNNIIELDPNLFQAYQQRGRLYAQTNDQVKALNDFNQVIQLNPPTQLSLCVLFYGYIQQGINRLQLCNRKQSSNFTGLHKERCILYKPMGDYDNALTEQLNLIQNLYYI